MSIALKNSNNNLESPNITTWMSEYHYIRLVSTKSAEVAVSKLVSPVNKSKKKKLKQTYYISRCLQKKVIS